MVKERGPWERGCPHRSPNASNAPSHWWEIHSWSSKAYYLIDIFHDVISFIYSPRDLKKKPQLKRQMSVSSLILTWCKDVTQEYEVNYSFSNYQVIDYSLSLWCTLLEPIPEVRLRENLKRRKKQQQHHTLNRGAWNMSFTYLFASVPVFYIILWKGPALTLNVSKIAFLID